jgi:hypothetical protein
MVVIKRLVVMASSKIKNAMKAAVEAEAQLVNPLFEFRNFGVQLPHHWQRRGLRDGLLHPDGDREIQHHGQRTAGVSLPLSRFGCLRRPAHWPTATA